jgi:hypothetical protein
LAFDQGFKGNLIASNFSNCGLEVLFWGYKEFPTYKAKMHYTTWKEGTVNTTIFLRNTSEPLYDCTDTAENSYVWYTHKRELFGSLGDFLLGGL